MSQVESGEPAVKYDQQNLMEELDHLNQQLEEMRETMMSTSVRAHILEVDIASLFDPEVEEELRKATEASGSCEKTMNVNAQKTEI